MVGEAGTGITETVVGAFGLETEVFFVFFLQPFGSKNLCRRMVQ